MLSSDCLHSLLCRQKRLDGTHHHSHFMFCSSVFQSILKIDMGSSFTCASDPQSRTLMCKVLSDDMWNTISNGQIAMKDSLLGHLIHCGHEFPHKCFKNKRRLWLLCACFAPPNLRVANRRSYRNYFFLGSTYPRGCMHSTTHKTPPWFQVLKPKMTLFEGDEKEPQVPLRTATLIVSVRWFPWIFYMPTSHQLEYQGAP